VYDLSLKHPIAAVVCAIGLASCSVLVNIDDKQCNVDTDCTSANLGDVCSDHVCVVASGCEGNSCNPADGGPGDGSCTTDRQCGGDTPRCMHGSCVSSAVADRWLCTATAPNATNNPTVSYGFHVVDFLSKQPPKNIVVNACRNSDVACAEPVGKFTDTTGMGHAQFNLPSGFLGYFEINSDATPALLYVTKPIVKDAENRDVPVLQPSTVQLTASVAKLPFDKTKGLALLEAIDCSGKPAGGVQFKHSADSADQFYLVDQVPSTDATMTEYDETENTADGGFINVSPGFVTFSALWGVEGPLLGAFNAQIRANTITYVDMDF
jgi:hypothetical protein